MGISDRPLSGKASNENVVKYRKAIMEGGRAYNAHVYGRREMVMTSISGLPLNGVAMDAEFAVSEWPSRRLEVGEVPPAGKEAVVDCPVSGKQAFEDAQTIAGVITDQKPAVQMQVQVVYFCAGAPKLRPHVALLLADGGGSNSSRGRLWKRELQEFATETGLTITICHYPPGTSKWNWIEHRLFSFLPVNCAG